MYALVVRNLNYDGGSYKTTLDLQLILSVFIFFETFDESPKDPNRSVNPNEHLQISSLGVRRKLDPTLVHTET